MPFSLGQVSARSGRVGREAGRQGIELKSTRSCAIKAKCAEKYDCGPKTLEETTKRCPKMAEAHKWRNDRTGKRGHLGVRRQQWQWKWTRPRFTFYYFSPEFPQSSSGGRRTRGGSGNPVLAHTGCTDLRSLLMPLRRRSASEEVALGLSDWAVVGSGHCERSPCPGVPYLTGLQVNPAAMLSPIRPPIRVP